MMQEAPACPKTGPKPTVTYNGLQFVPYIQRDVIANRVREIAADISRRFDGRVPLIVCVLNGAFPFASDLFRSLDIDAEITFIRYKSYEGMESTGELRQVQGLAEDIADRDVIIVEDIIDTGRTMKSLIEDMQKRNPRTLSVATLLFKPDALTTDVKPDYIGFSIPSKFILGYGLDLDGLARNLPDIWVLDSQSE
ncbi:MAG: hypoxanthine phosphoribosyltransferase [Pseudoflavonifractor sp.]|nr:hypoxanthine phosphoribosyltransferase [Alloprevotella sp.]MCM1116381.1 hypoxanthine phosphoribosyltransferase [Pseudoflavonifractor sp.]